MTEVPGAAPGTTTKTRSAERATIEARARDELEAWRGQAVPDPTAPLDAADIARLVRDCFAALGVDPDVGAGFSVNTVHFYRRKDVLDPPLGKTSAARYELRHLWQAAGARLAGQLGLVTLAEAREIMRGAGEEALLDFVAARLADARARRAVADAAPAARAGPAQLRHAMAATALRPLPSAAAHHLSPSGAVGGGTKLIPLPGDAWCVVPSAHPAHRSSDAARELVDALADALGVTLDAQADGG